MNSRVFSKNVAESVAKLATDELIEALKTVIEDFNAKITEQFGENFKQLNEAVGKNCDMAGTVSPTDGRTC